MKKAVGSLVIMVLAAIAGFFLGAALENIAGGMILLALIAGIACIVYAVDCAGKESSGKK